MSGRPSAVEGLLGVGVEAEDRRWRVIEAAVGRGAGEVGVAHSHGEAVMHAPREIPHDTRKMNATTVNERRKSVHLIIRKVVECGIVANAK